MESEDSKSPLAIISRFTLMAQGTNYCLRKALFNTPSPEQQLYVLKRNRKTCQLKTYISLELVSLLDILVICQILGALNNPGEKKQS